MIAVLACSTLVLTVLLMFASLLQLLYLESLRIRTREYAALEYFKQVLQDEIGLRLEEGAARFSMVKHTAMALLGVVCLLMMSPAASRMEAAVGAAGLSLALMLGATYLAPQILYRRTRLEWLRPAVPAIKTVAATAKPATGLLNFIYSLIELGKPETHNEPPPDAAEHVDSLITAGTEEGIIEEQDRRLIQSVVAFGDKTARDVMTPRPNIVAIEVNRSLEDLRQLVINEQYSRIPVYEGSIDQVIGFVHVRDMFELDEKERGSRTVRDVLRKVLLVPETKPVTALLAEMQHERAHMAIVVDEYGNTAGLVTLEDMVEVIVGEIHDEHEPEYDVTDEGGGHYVVSGSFDLDRVGDLLQVRLPEETESTTIGGLATEWAGHVPERGEVIAQHGLRIEVLAGNDLKVELVRLSRHPNGTLAAAE